MEINEFAQKVQSAIATQLGEKYKVELRKVRKNNGVILHGLLILSSTENVTPTIYLETFHMACEEGVPLAEVIRRILEIYWEETPGKSIDMDFFRTFCKVKDRICYRLIKRAGNEELLNDVPYVEFLDLAICFYYAYSGSVLGEGTILIHNSHMEMWGVRIQNLMKLAAENTPRLFPEQICSMTEILKEVMDVGKKGITGQEIPMTVLTNTRKVYGAACILYTGILEKIAAMLGKSFYIIPSSVHEVILLEKQGEEVPEELKKIIWDVNRTQVAAEEVLSDNLYFYDASQKSVKIIF